MACVDRRTVDLSAYPDLIVIYLGMRINALAGIKRVLGLGPQIAASVKAKPDGLLLHEDLLFSLFPAHVGMRQYWRDFESMERWTRSAPHRDWWKSFLRDSGGTGFWHETYSIRGGIEAIYDDMPTPVGLMKFAPLAPARGSVFSARQRLAREGSESSPAPRPKATCIGGRIVYLPIRRPPPSRFRDKHRIKRGERLDTQAGEECE